MFMFMFNLYNTALSSAFSDVWLAPGRESPNLRPETVPPVFILTSTVPIA